MALTDSFSNDLNGVIETDNVTMTHPDFTDADQGIPVKIAGSGAVTRCADGDPFVGKVVSVDAKGKICGVAVRGTVTLPYSGSDPSPGYGQIVADGTGKVKIGATGPSRLILQVDAGAKELVILL